MINDRRAAIVLGAAFVLLALSFGVRASFGVFYNSITVELGYAAATVSIILGVQNLIWGAAQPFAGRLADRFGAAPTAFVGALLYASGLVISSVFHDIWIFGLSAGVVIGMSQAALGLPVLLGAVGRTVAEEKRGLYLGIATAGASFGQLSFSPLSQEFMRQLGVVDALLALAAICCAAASLAIFLRMENRATPADAVSAEPPARVGALLGRAFRDRSFLCLNAGFFVCGFHVAFIGVHLPNFAVLCGLPEGLGVIGLMVIGGFNIVGTIVAGQLGNIYRPKVPLAWIYLLRIIVLTGILFIPVNGTVLILFSALMGFLWLSTVPLTSLIVGKLYGAANVGMLFGLVFMTHQLGSFTGLVLAGEMLEIYGNYDPMWTISIVLGVFAFLIHLPIEDNRQLRPAAA